MKIYKGIYCIMNTANNKKYIGSSINIKDRWSGHRSALNKGVHINTHLQSAWNKYGKDKFVFYIIEEIDVLSRKDLFQYEDSYILKFETLDPNKGYNKELSTRRLTQSIDSQVTLKAVLLLDLDGNITNEFISIAEAARFLECNVRKLDAVLHTKNRKGKKHRTIKNYQVIFKEDYNSDNDYTFIRKYRVAALDENLNILKTYNSVVEITKDYNIPIGSIYGAIKFGYKCREFYFKKLDKNNNIIEVAKEGERCKTKPIIVTTQTGEVYNFNSTTEGMKFFNIKKEKLKYVKNGIRKNRIVYGMRWAYI
jgi:group I intron endonuclease